MFPGSYWLTLRIDIMADTGPERFSAQLGYWDNEHAYRHWAEQPRTSNFRNKAKFSVFKKHSHMMHPAPCCAAFGWGPNGQDWILLTSNFRLGFAIQGGMEMPYFELELRYKAETAAPTGARLTEQFSKLICPAWSQWKNDSPRPDTSQLNTIYTFSSALEGVVIRSGPRPQQAAKWFRTQKYQETKGFPTEIEFGWEDDSTVVQPEFDTSYMSEEDARLYNLWTGCILGRGLVNVYVAWTKTLDDPWRFFVKQPVPTPPPYVAHNQVIEPKDHPAHDGALGIPPLQKNGRLTPLGEYYRNHDDQSTEVRPIFAPCPKIQKLALSAVCPVRCI